MKHKLIKLIAVILITAFGLPGLAWGWAGQSLRPLSAIERQRHKIAELMLGPDARSPRTLEEARRMAVWITDWLIGRKYSRGWFLPGYRDALSTAKLIDNEDLLMGKGIDISRSSGVTTAPYLMIGNRSLKHFDIDNIPSNVFGVASTIVAGEALGLAIYSILYSDIRGLFQRVVVCVSDPDLYRFRRMLNKFQGGRVTPSRFKHLDELTELDAFLQDHNRESRLLDLFAELISGEYMEVCERARMIEWLREENLIDDSAAPFLSDLDKWLYEKRNDRTALLALTIDWIIREHFMVFITKNPDVFKYELNTRVYGFFILHQILTWIRTGGSDGLDPAMAEVILRGQGVSTESINKFLPCAKLVAERVFKKADEIDRELTESRVQTELLRRVNAAGAQQIDRPTLQRILKITAIMKEAELTPGGVLYFKIILGEHGLGPLTFADRQIGILQEYEREQRRSRQAARQTLEGI